MCSLIPDLAAAREALTRRLVSSLTAQVKLVSAELGLVLVLICLAAVSWSQVVSTSTDSVQCLEPAKVFCLRVVRSMLTVV